MNVGDLIKELEKYPKDTPVCVDNKPIHFTSIEPAYWDGRLGMLIRDPKKTGYNIVGWKYTDKGSKVNIKTMSIADVVLDNPDIPVEYDLAEHSIDCYRDRVEKLREETRRIIAEVDKIED